MRPLALAGRGGSEYRAGMDPLPRWRRNFLWPLVMLAGVALLYLPPGAVRGDWSLFNNDFATLHQFRTQFARDELARNASLPGWYSRELCGTPFWSNVQNFPFIPTRLILLWLDPTVLFTVGVMLAALLAAWFTYLFARRLGWHPLASAAAGWTFASAGYFASRVPAGHLPLLEAYAALPLLLWLIERLAPSPSTLGEGQGRGGPDERPRASPGDLPSPLSPSQSTLRLRSGLAGRGSLVILGIAAMCISLAGHPQLPIYSLGVAMLYALVRFAGRLRWFVAAAIVAGVGCASFALVPMAKLAARSTRVLPLERADNDLAMPYARLIAFFDPWRHGTAMPDLAGKRGFSGYPNAAYFWDTVVYIGWLPWIALAVLTALLISRRIALDRRAVVLLAICVVALIGALPWVQQIGLPVRGTMLRSPARLMYLPTFGLSLALGAALHFVLTRVATARSAWIVALIAVAAHAWDLARHDRHFIRPDQPVLAVSPALRELIDQRAAAGRVAIDAQLALDLRWKHDDVGFFDSIILARSYRGIMALSRAPRNMNIQDLYASDIPQRVLRACAAAALVTDARRDDLRLDAEDGGICLYSIAEPAPRAGFYSAGQITSGNDLDADRALRDLSFDPQSRLVVARSVVGGSTGATGAAVVTYQRPGQDWIIVTLNAPSAGAVLVRESFDIGWRATLNGKPAEIVPGNLMFMAVAVPAGKSTIEMEFVTPGKWLGLTASMFSAAALVAIAFFCAGRPAPAAQP